MSNVYIAEKEQLDNQNTLLSTYNSTLQDIKDDLSDIATLAEQKQIKTVTPTKQKQIIEADEGYNSLVSVVVDATPLETRTVVPTKQQQTVTPQSPAVGLSSVTVEKYTPDVITKNIVANGTYSAADDGADGYLEVDVNIPPPVLEHGSAIPKATAETYTPQEDGFLDFTVEATPLEVKTVVPTTQQKVITPAAPNIGFSSVTVEGYVPPVEKDINFYNYLGDLIYGLTFQEALALTKMPPAPVIDGMEFQEWNWSLATIQAYAQNEIPVTVGAIYDTDDHSTRFYFHNEKYTALAELTIGVQMDANTSVTIDWGDGTTTTLENTSSKRANLTATKNDYAVASETKTVIVSIHGKIYSLFRNGYRAICFVGNERLLKKVEVGSDCSNIGSYAFNGGSIYLPNLSAISIANSVVSLAPECVIQLTKLKILCFPTSLSAIGAGNVNNSFLSIISYAENSLNLGSWDGTYSLSRLDLPTLTNAINGYAYRSARALTYIYIPKTVSSIGMQAFSGSGLRVVDLSGFEDFSAIPALENINAFPASAVFLVRSQERLDAFEAATNWSAYAGRYQIKGAVS